MNLYTPRFVRSRIYSISKRSRSSEIYKLFSRSSSNRSNRFRSTVSSQSNLTFSSSNAIQSYYPSHLFLIDGVGIDDLYLKRYTQRVTPVSATSSSANLMGFKELVTKTLEPHFGIKVSDSNVTSNHLNSSTHPLLRSGLQVYHSFHQSLYTHTHTHLSIYLTHRLFWVET